MFGRAASDHCVGFSWRKQCSYWPVLADLQEELEPGQLTVIPLSELLRHLVAIIRTAYTMEAACLLISYAIF